MVGFHGDSPVPSGRLRVLVRGCWLVEFPSVGEVSGEAKDIANGLQRGDGSRDMWMVVGPREPLRCMYIH